MKVVLYARVSTNDQNCEIQLKELRDYCSRRGWTLTHEYVDSGVSGAKASRPALDRLMTSAQQRDFDTVVVWKLDRFSRSVLHLHQQMDSLKRYGVRFLAVSQGIDTDASNPVSTLILQVLAAVAEFEREIIRERTIAGVRAAKAKGKTLGRPRIVFKRDEVLRLRDSEGLSWRAIGTRLNVTASTALNVYRELSPSPSSVQKPSPHSRPHSTRKRAS